jgi:very-short-patch-repair endonuclease
LLLQQRMPEDAFFTHTTAALLAGIPVPPHHASDARLHVSVPSPARAPHANGIRGHRSSASQRERVETDGVRHTMPARTWCDLADIVPLLDLVAAGDFVIHRRSPLATVADLAGAIDSRKSKRNVRKLREALLLLDDRAESPPESMLRVILVQAGFATPRVNHVVVDHLGEFVARTDLYLVEHNLVLEYQGDYHRSNKAQWRADLTRRSRIEATGPRVMELNADDLKDPIELVARIRKRIAVR